MNFALNKNKIFKANINNFNLITLKSKKINFDNFENINFLIFLEIDLNDINNLKKYTSEKLQTILIMAQFKIIKKFIINNKIKGIDRIVQLDEHLI